MADAPQSLNLVAIVRKIRACEGEVAAQLVLEYAIRAALSAPLSLNANASSEHLTERVGYNMPPKLRALVEAALWLAYCPEQGGYRHTSERNGRAVEDCWEAVTEAVEAFTGHAIDNAYGAAWMAEEDAEAIINPAIENAASAAPNEQKAPLSLNAAPDWKRPTGSEIRERALRDGITDGQALTAICNERKAAAPSPVAPEPVGTIVGCSVMGMWQGQNVYEYTVRWDANLAVGTKLYAHP